MCDRILVIEDDADINGLLKRILSRAGYEVDSAYSGTEGKMLVQMNQYALVLMDLMLPGLSGEELLEELRRTKKMPVIVLSAKAGLEDKVHVLGIGADDYMVKPFEKQELLARVEAQLRRAGSYSGQESQQKECLVCGDLRLYPQACAAELKGQEIVLTTHEFKILEVMMAHPSKVFSKEGLYQSVWNNGYYGEDNAVSVHVSNIRKKLAAVSEEEYIKTVWGIGYKMNANL